MKANKRTYGQIKTELLDCEDRIAKVCIAYGEKRITKNEFDDLTKQANKRQKELLKELEEREDKVGYVPKEDKN